MTAPAAFIDQDAGSSREGATTRHAYHDSREAGGGRRRCEPTLGALLTSMSPRYARVMPTRELTADEKGVLEFVLSQPFPGRDELRAQLASVGTTGLSCRCGCPSIWLEVDRSMSAAPVVGSLGAIGRDIAGNIVDVRLLLEKGYMKELDFTDIAGTSGSGAVGIPTLASLHLVQRLESGGVVDLNRLP